MAGRLVLVWSALFVLVEVAHGEGNYQHTRDGKTIVWNNYPKPGDLATWSGARDRARYARGFGQLTWYTKERGFVRPQFYARYWGRMVEGKFEGPVNVHVKRKTHYAIFVDGARVTSWIAGTAPSQANARWRELAMKHRTNIEPASGEELQRGEPRAPAAGPEMEKDERGRKREESQESVQDLYNERWPKEDIDDSLRLLVFPPRSLRIK